MNITTICDNSGRIIIGEKTNNGAESIRLKNPAIIHVVPNPQTKQLQVQLLPYIFHEFLDSSKKDTSWDFPHTTTVIGNEVSLDVRLINQYNKMFNPSAIILPENAPTAPIVKLFED
jgi:hypothetical protein